jgi:class 3 adenylate cyclase/tetratricopeptide (TPR) repeat protein
MKCTGCRTENPETNRFCRECGAKLFRTCDQCGAECLPADKFCGNCGHHLATDEETSRIDFDQPRSYTPKFLAEKILTARSAIEGERKLVTVLFADVAGFTSLSEKLDPEDVHEIMDGCFRILMDEIHRFEGTVNEFRGDGLMALFGAPIAHEDHAQRACHAAVAAQRALVPYAEKLQKEYGVDFKMRIGLNSGPVVVGVIGDDLRMDYTAQGDTANLAARMESNAEPRTVLVSGQTHRLTKDFFEFGPRRTIQVKGKEEPQDTYELVRARDIHTRIEASVARGLTELVGRRHEMESLMVAFEKAKRRVAQIVDVIGEAGVGKSRLVHEFEKTIGSEAIFLTGICAHHGRNVNFLPVIDVVRTAFGIQQGMTEEETGDRIEETSAENLKPMIPFYRTLLSLKVDDPRFNDLNPEGRRFGTFEAVKNLLLAKSSERPLVIFLEDVHWIDKISEDLFTFFSRCILEHPILMVAAYRPEGSPPWDHGAHYQRLSLEPLDSDLEKQIVTKTGGDPFFVEEIVRDLLDRGDIVETHDRYVCHKPIDQLQIPDTIQGVLSARMDRLSEGLKQTMQVASVIGRDFPFRLLKSIMEPGEDLRRRLSDLVGLDILYEKTLYPELEYIFKHALTQEVAYESLLKQRRRQIHGRIAKAMEDLYADRLEQHYELLAHHWELSATPQRSIEHLVMAGERSNKTQAADAAVDFFTRALNQMAKDNKIPDPGMAKRIRVGRAAPLHAMGRIEESLEDFIEAIRLSRETGDERTALTCLTQVPMLIYNTTEKDRIPAFCEEGLDLARALNNKGDEARITAILTHWRYVWGLSDEFASMYQALALAKQSCQPAALLTAGLLLAILERWRGNPGKALGHCEGIVEMLRSGFNIFLASAGAFARGLALTDVGKYDEAIRFLREWIDLMEQNSIYLNLGRCYNSLGWAYSEIYDFQRAISLNKKALENVSTLRTSPSLLFSALEMEGQSQVNLMENKFDMGSVDEAWDHIVRFEQVSDQPEYAFLRDRWASRLELLKGNILLSRGNLDEAEELARGCLDTAVRRGYKKYAARAERLLGNTLIRREAHETAETMLRSALLRLEDVGNPKQIWTTHNSLARLYKKMNRHDLAREQWQASASVVQLTADGLQDKDLRGTFTNAAPVRQIMEGANR